MGPVSLSWWGEEPPVSEPKENTPRKNAVHHGDPPPEEGT